MQKSRLIYQSKEKQINSLTHSRNPFTVKQLIGKENGGELYEKLMDLRISVFPFWWTVKF